MASCHHVIMSSCHHVITSSRHQLFTTFAVFYQVLPSFGNFWEFFFTIFGNYWNLLATFVMFLQLLNLLAYFGNSFWVTFGYIQLSIFWPLFGNFGNLEFWQPVAFDVTTSPCYQAILPSCHLFRFSSYHFVILLSCPLFIRQLVNSSACQYISSAVILIGSFFRDNRPVQSHPIRL